MVRLGERQEVLEMKIKAIRQIAVGDDLNTEVDRNGKWQRGYGPKVTIEGYDFIFIPTSSPNGFLIQAYSLDSLKLFDEMQMSLKTGLIQCATKDGFIEAVAPLMMRISDELNKIKPISKWEKIFEDERRIAITECGARNERERQLLKEGRGKK